MKKKITFANAPAITRLQAVEAYQKGGLTLQDLAEKFGVHKTTISEWIKMYEEGGVDRLKVPLKPRTKHVLDVAELEDLLKHQDDRRLRALLALAKTGHLNETAQAYGVTPQGLAKWRRQYLNGELS